MENLLYEYFRDKDGKIAVQLGQSDHIPAHFHRNIEIMYVTDGEVEARVADERFSAMRDDIIFVHNYSVHELDQKHEKYFIIIPPYYSSDLDNSLSKTTLPPLLSDREFNRTLLPLFRKIHEDRHGMPSLVTKGYLNVLFGSLLSHYPTRLIEKNSDLDFILRVLSYVEEHYTDQISLDSISLHFGYNKYYFSRLFNNTVGENLSNYINMVRLREFMKKTKETGGGKISKLALQCGFESLPTFYRYFAKVHGTSPREYFGSVAKRGAK